MDKHLQQNRLDAAIAEWRDEAQALPVRSLSDDSRRVILQSALQSSLNQAESAPQKPLFVPMARWAWLGALPVLVLTLALGWLAQPTLQGPGLAISEAESTVLPVHATKSGDDVIFLIANGHKPHAVYKSGAPNRFDTPPAFYSQDGAFRDRLNDGSELVFYRID